MDKWKAIAKIIEKTIEVLEQVLEVIKNQL